MTSCCPKEIVEDDLCKVIFCISGVSVSLSRVSCMFTVSLKL